MRTTSCAIVRSCSRRCYVLTFLNIFAGAGDIHAVRRALAESIAEPCPAFTMCLTSFSAVKAIRSDPEINGMLVEWLGY